MRRKRRQLQPLRQSSQMDCGLVALEMVLSHYGATGVRQTLRKTLGYTDVGTTMHGLVTAARACGFDADAFAVPVEQLDKLPLPSVLHWRQNHFVVLEELSADGYTIIDPAAGRRRVTQTEMQRRFSGAAVAVEPAEYSKQGHATKSSGWQWLRSSVRTRDCVEAAVALIAAGAAAVLGVPRLTSSAVLAFEGTFDIDLATETAICSLVTAGSLYWLLQIQERLTNRLGDIVRRYTIDALQQVAPAFLASRTKEFAVELAFEADPLFNTNAPRPLRLAILAGVPVLLLFAASRSVMISLGSIAVLAGWASIAAAGFVRNDSRTIKRQAMLDQSRERLHRNLADATDLAAAGVLARRFEFWWNTRTTIVRDRNLWVLPSASEGLMVSTIIIFFLGQLELAVHGTAAADTIAATLFGEAALVVAVTGAGEWSRARRWLSGIVHVQELMSERLPVPPGLAKTSTYGCWNSTPVLECLGVAHTPVAGDPAQLSDVDLRVDSGHPVAIIGGSGTGKSQLAKILLGLSAPTSGAVLYAGTDIRLLSGDERGLLVAGILDDADPTAPTIEEFLQMRGEPKHGVIRRVCADIGLGPLLERLPLGLQTPMTRAAGLASHERRLLNLARFLVVPPRVLLLDTVLDTLDTEYARGIAAVLARDVEATALFTSRPEIVPDTFRKYTLIGGRLRLDFDPSAADATAPQRSNTLHRNAFEL